MNVYDPGDLVRLSLPFDVADVPTDPSTITLVIRQPDGIETTLALGNLVRDSAGRYHYDLAVNLSGVWAYSVRSTGAAEGGAQAQFYVLPPLT